MTSNLVGYRFSQNLFTLEAARISGIDDLAELLEALDALNADKRQRLIEVWENSTVKLAQFLIRSSWWKDASRDLLNIRKALTTFRRAIDLGKAWSSLSLVRSSYVEMSILYDEYDNTPNNALAVLDEATAVFGQVDAHLLKQRAMVLFHRKNYQEAVALFDQALAGEDLDNVERTFAGRTGGIAAARSSNWESAERFFLTAASAAEETNDVNSMAVGLKADAAFARWKQGRHTDALRLYAEVLELLEEMPIDEDLQRRHVHATVRHCLAWIDNRTRGTSEASIAEPPPGACSNPEPYEGLKDHSITEMSAVWGLLRNIDTSLGTGLNLTHQAEQRSNGALPLIIRLGDRAAHYEALWNGTDLPRAVSIVIGCLESDMCFKQLNANRSDGWAPGEIPPLPDGYWEDQDNRAYLLFSLIAAGVLALHLYPVRLLPVEEWMHDMRSHNAAGADVDRFLALLTGTERRADGSLLEEAALALRRIREETLPPNHLFICHFKLFNALYSGEWGKYAGTSLAKIVAAQWLNVSENHRFALTSPGLYAPLLREKCEDTRRDGLAKVASILKTAAVAAGVGLAESAIECLTQVERGEGNPPSTA